MASAEAKQYIPLHVFEDPTGKALIIQTGTFNCPVNQHRSFLVSQSGLVIPGCSEITTDTIKVHLETGMEFNIPYKSVLS